MLVLQCMALQFANVISVFLFLLSFLQTLWLVSHFVFLRKENVSDACPPNYRAAAPCDMLMPWILVLVFVFCFPFHFTSKIALKTSAKDLFKQLVNAF